MYENQAAVKANGQWTPNGVVGGAFTSPSQVDRVLALDNINQGVVETNAQLGGCLSEITTIADSLFGAQPLPAEKSGISGLPSLARIDGLSRNTADTRTLVRLLSEQIDRFRSL